MALMVKDHTQSTEKVRRKFYFGSDDPEVAPPGESDPAGVEYRLMREPELQKAARVTQGRLVAVSPVTQDEDQYAIETCVTSWFGIYAEGKDGEIEPMPLNIDVLLGRKGKSVISPDTIRALGQKIITESRSAYEEVKREGN